VPYTQQKSEICTKNDRLYILDDEEARVVDTSLLLDDIACDDGTRDNVQEVAAMSKR
jgi:hypothetical protein